jgi:AbrB family looped-hinge helix DNA binding protein
MTFEEQRFKGVMSLSKISPKRQVVIPEDICEVIGAQAGDYIEFVQREGEIIIKAKKLVDAVPSPWDRPAQPPPASTPEERCRILDQLQAAAVEANPDDFFEDSEKLIQIIKESRTIKQTAPEFD